MATAATPLTMLTVTVTAKLFGKDWGSPPEIKKGTFVFNSFYCTLFNGYFKAGVHVKAVLRSLTEHGLSAYISVTFQATLNLSAISLTTVWRFCVNLWVIFGHFGKEIFFLKDRLN